MFGQVEQVNDVDHGPSPLPCGLTPRSRRGWPGGIPAPRQPGGHLTASVVRFSSRYRGNPVEEFGPFEGDHHNGESAPPTSAIASARSLVRFPAPGKSAWLWTRTGGPGDAAAPADGERLGNETDVERRTIPGETLCSTRRPCRIRMRGADGISGAHAPTQWLRRATRSSPRSPAARRRRQGPIAEGSRS